MRNARRLISLVAVSALIAGCGSGTVASTTTTSPETTTSALATSTSSTDHHEDHDMTESTSTSTTVPGSEGRVIEIVMTEFAFEPGVIHVDAGETVSFIVKNEGLVEHELRLSNEHRIDEHLASGHDDHDGGHHDEDGDVYVVVKPGETGEMTFTFPEDTTLYTKLACLIPGHYEAGMHGELTVEPA